MASAWVNGILAGALWVFFSALFVFGRLGSLHFLRNEGLFKEDWVLLASWICFAVNTIFWSVQYYVLLPIDQADPWATPDRYTNPVAWRKAEILQTVAIDLVFAAEALSKTALSLFLIHLTTVRWHRAMLQTLYITILIVCAFTIATTTACAATRSPDPITGVWTSSWLPINTYAIFVKWVMLLLFDILIAAFPWYMLRSVHLPKSKKLVICLSLSLGVISGITCIYRIILILHLMKNKSLNTVYIWSMAEIGITLICVSTPGLFPLWYNLQRYRRRRLGIRSPEHPHRCHSHSHNTPGPNTPYHGRHHHHHSPGGHSEFRGRPCHCNVHTGHIGSQSHGTRTVLMEQTVTKSPEQRRPSDPFQLRDITMTVDADADSPSGTSSSSDEMPGGSGDSNRNQEKDKGKDKYRDLEKGMRVGA